MHPMIAFALGNLYALCGVTFVSIVNDDAHRHRWHRLAAPVRAALALVWPLGAMLFFSSDSRGQR